MAVTPGRYDALTQLLLLMRSALVSSAPPLLLQDNRPEA